MIKRGDYSSPQYREVYQRYFDPDIDNTNMLHPHLYSYIDSKLRQELIIMYDTEKYLLRKAKKRGQVKCSDWGKKHNRLHIDKKFIGSDCYKTFRTGVLHYPGTVTESMKNWILNTHGLIVPVLNKEHYFSIEK